MSVIMILLASLVTALLAIGIIGGMFLCGIAVFRLLTGRGAIECRSFGRGKRVLLAFVCLLSALSLLLGGFFGVRGYQAHKDAIWSCVQSQSAEDGILPDFLIGKEVTQ